MLEVDGLGSGALSHLLSDEAMLAYAPQAERAVLTINRRDFVRLHRQGISHAGIIACTQDADVLGQTQHIHEVFTATGLPTNNLLRVVRAQS